MEIQSKSVQQLLAELTNQKQNADATTDAAPDILPGVSQLACSGDPGAMLAALTMQSAHEQDETARAQRDEATKAEVTADNAEIQDMHDKADMQRAQGIVDGACDVADAGMEMAQGAKTLDATNDRIQADDPGTTKAQAQSLRRDAASSDAAATGWKSGVEAMNGLKSILHGEFDAEITDKDADAKQQDISAQTFKQMADDAHDDEKDAKDLLNKALDFYKEYTDTKNQTTLAASHRA